MELLWRLRGWVRLRLTSADCTRRLREISREIRLEQIEFSDPLNVEFTVCRADAERIRVQSGDTLVPVREGGLSVAAAAVGKWRILAAVVLLLGLLTLWLPKRVLFVRVEGNGEIPARLILEKAEECGVRFGAPGRSIRSEQLKNHLLWALPELRWAGINVEGCTAVITVAPREPEEQQEQELPGDIVARVDAVVTEVIPAAGTAMTAPGQAVRAGQILISGTTDLGLSTRVDRAEGEVYGLTRRTVTVKMPGKTCLRQENGAVERKYSLRIGKKAVNFSNDSGILHGSCVKMRTVNYLTLPGGFQLPVALVTDTCRLCEETAIPREIEAEDLAEQARRYVREQMTAGTILSEELRFEDGVLTAAFECRELIGVFRPGIYTEGDTNDRESGER